MPYLKPRDRTLMETAEPSSPGELNYALTTLCLRYIRLHNMARGGPSYETFNAVVGALECCKQELYRRAVAPYEDGAIARNGDVYP